MRDQAISVYVCSHSHSFILDNFIRRFLQNPRKIVGEYIEKGDTIIDLGCGPGFFSIEMAKMVGRTGRVYSVDLQKEMLEKVREKAVQQGLLERIHLHECPQHTIGLETGIYADFVLAFYMVHETPDSRRLLKEVKGLLKKEGRFLIVEPTFHVSKKRFAQMRQEAETQGFSVIDTPARKGGRSLLLKVS